MGNVETLFPWVMWSVFAGSVGAALWMFVVMVLDERETLKDLDECVAGIEREISYDRHK